MKETRSERFFDLAVIGGGVNGCGIARDAAGRGLDVLLVEQNDLASATSGASTKLFHGGLRYLEYYEFRLVREALLEREVLLEAMPHISWPMRFVLPHHEGLRPSWLLRLGLAVYDNIGGRKLLPPTKTLDLRKSPLGEPLKDIYTKAFEYSDCWIEDTRLVVLNARDAADRGADVRTRTRLESAERQNEVWHLTLRDMETGETWIARASGLVNAGGPWVEEIYRGRMKQNAPEKIRLVRGSHIVTRKLFDHDQPYIFQQADGRIIFAIPYESDFTLIGTTDRDHEGDPSEANCTEEEADYLREAASEYFEKPIEKEDIVWTYSGVRPLFDDGKKSATAATRDYVLTVSDANGSLPLLNIFGGKITTYRRLAEAAMAKLAPYFPAAGGEWTAGVALPGGDFAVDAVEAEITALTDLYPFLERPVARRLVKAYGTEAADLIGEAREIGDLGPDFGHGLTGREVGWLMDREWARTADDVLWRRSKLGLRLTPDQAAALDEWMAARRREDPESTEDDQSGGGS